MAFKMANGSLFAILLRSHWWYSAIIGLAFIAISLLVADGKYLILGISGALPFWGIALYVVYNQSKLPSQQRVHEVDTLARKMSGAQIADKITACYTAVRYDAKPFKGDAADVELSRGNRMLMLSSKRFKAGDTGIEPLKQLVAAGEKVEATGYLYVALGRVSDAANNYAQQNNIEIIQSARLAAYFDGQANVE